MSKSKLPPAMTAWSYSRYGTWSKCPRLAYYKFVKKLPEPKNKAMERGLQVHDMAERYIKGELMGMPVDLLRFKTRVEKLREMYKDGTAHVEDSWAFNSRWEETEYFAPNAWCRIKTDVWEVLRPGVVKVTDWKTGKPRDGYGEQLRLYATGAFYAIADVEEVETELAYLDTGEVVGGREDPDGVYKVEDAEKLRQEWDDKVAPMLADRHYKPNPGYHCRWCHFSRSNGGPCDY